MAESYWNQGLGRRFSRRRALTATGGAAAAALLAACGGSDTPDDASKTSSLIVPVVDETKNVKRGGIYKEARPTPATLDPHLLGGHVSETQHAYSTLFRIADGHMKDTDYSIEGELVESWELSADKLTLTGKLTQNANFAPLPPINGRRVEMQDILFSWERFRTLGARRSDVVNEANPDAPVVSLTSPDDRTIVIKFKEPNATALALLASASPGALNIIPREAESPRVLDLRSMSLGSGPFYMSELKPSVGMSFKKNPGFKWDKRDVPYIEGIEYYDVSEYAALLAQFKAGALWAFSGGVRAEDVLNTKRDVPELILMDSGIATSATRGFFGHNPDSPFKDERVRQAWVLTWDRDLFIDVIYNVSKFAQGGLQMETAWAGALPASDSGWYINPKSKEFGPNAKYFEHSPSEAKKLLTAAGYPNGLDTSLYYATTFPVWFYQQSEILIGMVRDSALFRPTIHEVNYQTDWNTTFRYNRGKFSGAGFVRDTGAPHPVNNLFYHYHTNGGANFGGDSTMDDLLVKAQREFDTKRAMTLAHEVQRYEGGKAFYPLAGGASSLTLSWPVERNKGVWNGGSNRNKALIWMDQEKPPIKRA